jgi:hypothetical protein
MDHYQTLSLTAQTAYAQLLDTAQALELRRSVASLKGSFASKQVKGRTYRYFQYFEVSGKLRQIYVGPDSERVRTLIAQHGQGAPEQALEPLARSAMALGCEPILPAHYKVMRRLADYGFFKAGGVLIGSHAFLAYGNMFGVAWGDSSRTQDVDFAHAGKHIEIALPGDIDVDTDGAIESLQMGFLPITNSAGKVGGTYLNSRDPDFQLDFLTPLHRGGSKPYEHEKLKLTLQPIKFIEYILENVQQVVLFCADGAVVANVPHPARYALHKLIVSGERPASRAVKASKDLRQSAALLAWYRSGSDWDLREAWADLIARGPGWVSRLRRGRDALAKLAPELGVREWLKLPGEK